MKAICTSVALMFICTGCGFLGFGNTETVQSRPGSTVYRAADQSTGDAATESPSTEKVPGESRH